MLSRGVIEDPVQGGFDERAEQKRTTGTARVVHGHGYAVLYRMRLSWDCTLQAPSDGARALAGYFIA